MATGGKNTIMYNGQVAACQIFFHKEIPDVQKCQLLKEEHEIPKNMKHYAKPIHLIDITGLDAHHVTAVLVNILGDKEYKKNKSFYLALHNTDESEDNQIKELFRLNANPKENQPGNGILYLRPRGRIRFTRGAKDYSKINDALGAYYKKDTKSFAKDIKELFLNNATVERDLPQATIEVYMIFLFEIARRLVALEKPNDTKEQFDVLPVGSAIAEIVKLLEYGHCTFKDVFFPGGKFHCFSKTPKIRKQAIDEINRTVLANIEREKRSSQPSFSTKPSPLPNETISDKVTKYSLKELRETFCSKQSSADRDSLSSQFQSLEIKEESDTPSILKSSKNTEAVTAFDCFEDATNS